MTARTRQIDNRISNSAQLIRRRRKLSLAAAVGMTVAAIPQLASADVNWVGGTSNDWNNTANWSASPGNQTLIINNTTNFPVISGTPTFADVDLRIGTGTTGRVDQTAGTAGTGNGNWMFLGYSGGNATYNLANTATTGGTFTGFGQGSGNFSAGEIFVGLDNGTNSTLNVNTSGSLTTSYLALGSNGASNGNLNIDNGTVNVSGELQVGGNMFAQGAGTDTLRMSGGTVTANVISFSRGNNNTNTMTGVGNITGGTLTANTYLTLGYAGSSSAHAIVTNNGGTINVGKTGKAAMEMTVYDSVSAQYTQGSGALNIDNSSTIAFGNGGNNNSVSTFTQNGGTVTFYGDGGTTVGGTGSLILGVGGSTGNYTYNLNGGTLSVPLIQKTAAGASGNFNFNGGTLKATGNSTTFMTGLTSAKVQVGGAIIDTNGFNVTVGQALLTGNASDGGLTKIGAATLTLSGANTYLGNTTISGGTLQMNSTNSTSAAVIVNSGGTLALNVTDALGFADAKNVPTINSGGTITNITSASRMTLWNGLTMTGGTLTSTGAGDANGAYSLSGGVTATSDAGGTAATISGAPISLQNRNVNGGAITFNVSRGSATPASDLNVTANLIGGTFASNVGITKSGSGIMTLLGNNSYSGQTTISGGTLQLGNGITDGTIAATSGLTNNAALVYNWANNHTAAYAISGSGSVTKLGAGVATLSAGNSYTGDTLISAGKLAFSTAASSIGNVTVANGAGLSVKAASSNSTLLTTTSLTAGNSSLSFDLNTLTPTTPLISTGVFTDTGTIALSLANFSTLPSGNYTLVGYSSFAGGGTFSNTSYNLTPRSSGIVSNNGTNALILSVNGDTPKWTGLDNGNWVVGSTGANHNWQLISAGSPTDYIEGDLVVFDDSATGSTSVNISAANVSPTSVVFNNSSQTYTIGSTGGFGIAGSTGLMLNGSGTVIVTNSNPFTGATSINAGTLQLGDGTSGHDGTIANTSGVTLASGATLAFNRFGATTAGYAIAGNGAVTMGGNGTQILTAVNTYTGPTTISSGTLQLGDGTTDGTITASSNIVDNGTLIYNRIGGFTYANPISGTGSVVMSGTGFQYLAASNSYGGGTVLNGGTLAVGGSVSTNSNALGTGAVTINAGATLRAGYAITSNQNVATIANNITLVGGAIFEDDAFQHLTGNLSVTADSILGSTFNGGGGDTNKGLFLDGAISGTGNLTLQQSGYNTGNFYNTSMVLFTNNGNTYAGTVNVVPMTGTGGGSYLGLNASNALQFAAVNLQGNNAAAIFGNSPLVFNTGLGSATLGSLAGSGNVVLTGYNQTSHAYGVDAVALTVGGNNGSTTYSGAMSGAGSLTKTGSGTMTLSSATSSFTGDLTINGGNITDNSGAVGTNAAVSALGALHTARNITLNNGSTLTLAQGNELGTGGTGTVPSATIVVNQGGVFQTGSQTGAGGFWNLVGPLTLNGATVNVGTGANNSNFQALDLLATVTVGGNSASTIQNFAGALAGSSGIHLGQGTATGQAITFNVADATNDANSDLIISAPLLNTAGNIVASGLTKTGSGTLELANANTFSGTTSFGANNSGTIKLSNASALGGGGIFTFAGFTGNTLDIATNGSDTASPVNSNTGFSGTIASDLATPGNGINHALGAAALGGGTLNVVAGSNVTGGAASISFSALTLSSGSGGNVTLNPTTANLSILGNVTAITTAKSLILDGTSAGNQITGTIFNGNGLSLVKSNSSTWTLTGASTYTGNTTITGGTLQLGDGTSGHDGTIANTPGIAISGGATLAFNRFGNVSSSYPISGAGSVVKSGAGTQTLTGSNSYTGDTSINAGTLAFSTSQSSIGNVILADGAGLSVKAASSNSTLLTTTSLTAGNSSLSFDLNTLTPTTPLISTGVFTDTGTIALSLANFSTLPSGNYTLVGYTSFAGGGTFSNTSYNLTPRSTGIISNNGVALILSVNGDTPKWTGLDNGNWVVGSTGANHNWQLISAGSPTDYIEGDLVVFDDSATGSTSVNISAANVSPTSVVFNNSSQTYTIGSTGGFGIAGNTGLMLNGSGTVIVTNSNPFTGATSINAGTLQLGDGTSGHDGTIANTSGVTLASGATLAFNRFGATTAGYVIAGNGAVTMSGNGTQILTAVNTYTGPTTISSGTLQLGDGTTDGTIASTSGVTDNGALVYNWTGSHTAGYVISGSGTVTNNGTGTTTFTGVNSYSGDTTVNAGTLLSNVNGFVAGSITPFGSGNITVNSGAKLQLVTNPTTAANSYTIANAMVVNGGTVNLFDATQHLTGTISVGAGGARFGSTFNNGTNAATEANKGLFLDGVVSGSGNITLQQTGIATGNFYNSSIVYFSNNANSYNGTVTVVPVTANGAGSYLGLNASNALASATVNLSGNNNGTIFGNSPLVFNTGLGAATLGALTGSGNVTLTGYNESAHTYGADAIALTVGGNDASTTYSGTMSGAGSLTKTGNGTLFLTSANSYSGGTSVSAGALQITTTAGAANTGVFNLSGGAFQVNLGTGTNFNYAPTINLLGNATFSNAAVGSNANLNGQINFTGTVNGNGNVLNIANAGSARLYINGTLNNVGQINVQSGAIGFDVNSGNNRGTAPVDIASGAALWFAGVSNQPIANNLTFHGGNGINGGGALYYEGGSPTPAALIGNINLAGGNTGIGSTFGDTITLSGAISGAGGLNVLNGTAVVLASNSYSGGTIVAAGAKVLANNATSSLGSGDVAVASGAGAYGGGFLGGSGTVAANVALAASSNATQGGGITAGPDAHSNGTLTTGAQTWNGGAAYVWKISDLGANADAASGNSTTPGATTDNLSMTGLTVNSGGATPTFTIATADLNTLTPAGTYSWVIAQVTGGAPVLTNSGLTVTTAADYVSPNLLNPANTSNSSVFALDTSSFIQSGSNFSAGSFSLEFVGTGSGDNLVLDYNAAPEPTTALLALTGGIPMLLARRRRRTANRASVANV